MSNFNFNRVILGGRLTRNLELKSTSSGKQFCNFNVATDKHSGSDKSADFFDCVAWDKNAEFLTKYFRKGSSICIEGYLNTRSYEDSNGNKRYVTEIITTHIYFVDSRNESEQGSRPEPYSSPSSNPNFEEVSADDDLPF